MPTVTKQTMRATSVNGAPSAWDLVDSIRLLLYGESGTGKTTFWATFPGPILALICSGGQKPGELRSINTPEYRKKIDARVISTSDELCQQLERAKDFATVVQDHATGLQDLFLKEIMGWDETAAQRPIIGDNRQTWGEVALRSKDFFRKLLSLPVHVVIVAQQRTFGGADDGIDPQIIKPTVGAALTPSVVGWLNPACDYVLQMFKRPRMATKKVKVGDKLVEMVERGKGVDYCARCEVHDVFMTKFRILKGRELPDVIVDPTYDKLVQIIQGG